MKACCFPGTKPHDIIWRSKACDEKFTRLKNVITARLAELIELKDVTHFITGITIPTDLYTAELVMELKKTYPQITLECVFLFKDQTMYWKKTELKRYSAIAKKVDNITIMEETYTIKCHTLLTNYLVEKGDYFMAFFEGMSGYAVDTVMSALHNNKCVFIINPDDI